MWQRLVTENWWWIKRTFKMQISLTVCLFITVDSQSSFVPYSVIAIADIYIKYFHYQFQKSKIIYHSVGGIAVGLNNLFFYMFSHHIFEIEIVYESQIACQTPG